MSARFRIHSSFDFKSRRAWVLIGDIEQGVIRPGMCAHFRLNEATGMTAPIRAVEYVDSKSGSHIGLVFDCEDEIARAMWEGFSVPGNLLEITDHDPAAPRKAATSRRATARDTAVDRLLRGLPILAFGVIAAGLLAWQLLIARHPGVDNSAECRAEYQRARSAADSAIIDARVPQLVQTREPNLPTCGTLRRTGELR